MLLSVLKEEVTDEENKRKCYKDVIMISFIVAVTYSVESLPRTNSVSFGSCGVSSSIVFLAPALTSRAFDPDDCVKSIIAVGLPLNVESNAYDSEPS